MTSHPHRSKKAWSTIRISARDARDLALMLNLHVTRCETEANAALSRLGAHNIDDHARLQKSAHSWARMSRKARAFSDQLRDMALEAENGMASGVRQLR
jgi:hypothetical protein